MAAIHPIHSLQHDADSHDDSTSPFDTLENLIMNFQPGQTVLYLITKKLGVVTGNQHGNKVEVDFGPADRRYIQANHLLPLDGPGPSLTEKFETRLFHGIEDFRKTFGRIRLSGELTNMMYSMGNTKTDFYAHQFVPVLKFLSSSRNRLLIADEVGLGKTIESMFIWQELRARDGAHRLLIVAPAVLKEKWIKDLNEHFDIEARDVAAADIWTAASEPTKPFVLVGSIQGLRMNAGFLNFLEENADSPSRHLFDLVVIDEAHYMRNDKTESYKLGRLLRNNSENFVLLSATPIQTGTENFFNLLRLLAPDEFSDADYFEKQLEECKPLVRLANALDQRSPKELVRNLLDQALNTGALQGGSQLTELERHFDEYVPDTENEEDCKKRLKWIEELKKRYFYYPWVCRMRKRDVFNDRPIREAATIDFELSETEGRFYKVVSNYLLKQDEGNQDDESRKFSAFRLIARQRQMASCIPAALRAWRNKPLHSTPSSLNQSDFDRLFGEYEFEELNFPPGHADPMPFFPEFALDELERNDTKFNHVFDKIKSLLETNPLEKIILFSFFRGTVQYLQTKLTHLGVSSELILGGLPASEKTKRIERFRTDPKINVLLSTEVGSEGIDLQFARVEINYDLPWNPMRVEQRIGRIDRIGQKNKMLFIYNAFCSSTIEDLVMFRLHRRIQTFKDVLGDLEVILGPTIKAFELKVFRRGEQLTEAEIVEMEKELDEIGTKQEELAHKIQDQSLLLSHYEKYVLEGIKRSQTNQRMLSGKEIAFLVKEFLNGNYPGSSVQNGRTPSTKQVSLSQQARRQLSEFLQLNPQIAKTDLSIVQGGVECAFGSRPEGEHGNFEVVDINHGLVRWMLSRWKTFDAEWGCNSVSVPCSSTSSFGVSPGCYVYYVQQWRSQGGGAPRTNELKYFVTESGSGSILPDNTAEQLISTVLMEGCSANCPLGLLDASSADAQTANERRKQLHDAAWAAADAFESERRRFVQDTKTERKTYLDKFFEEKEKRLKTLIQTQKGQGKDAGIIRANEGKLEKIKAEHGERISEVETAELDFAVAEIAYGIIQVTEE